MYYYIRDFNPDVIQDIWNLNYMSTHIPLKDLVQLILSWRIK